MARPRKDRQQEFRLPTYHAASNRWRLRIEHGHGEKVFWWPALGPATAPPPEVIAEAVAAQERWRQIVEDWPVWIRRAMELDRPDEDWARPVWIDVAVAQAVVDRFTAENAAWVEEREGDTRRDAIRQIGERGLADIIVAAQSPGVLSADLPQVRAQRPDIMAEIDARNERTRLQALAELAPARRRLQFARVREALKRYFAWHRERTQLTCGDWIEGGTYETARCNLLGVFGLSTSETEHPIRDPAPPIDLDDWLPQRDVLEALARYWHKKPTAVRSDRPVSDRTVRNYLMAGRSFWKWCSNRYAFEFPDEVAKLYTADNVETPAEEWNPARIAKILSQGKTRGGERLKLYALLGLLNGYGQTDCCEIADLDYFREGDDRFIKRFRSKEAREKRGSRPIRIKHWIAPELADMVDRNRGLNPRGFLFNSERGTVLTADAVTGVWERAVEDAGDGLVFKQLRKLGYNRIKHHAKSLEVAELWDGHSGGMAKHYDDGIFVPVIDAQRSFADELRTVGIL